jgi:anti-sigma B factor antagonist
LITGGTPELDQEHTEIAVVGKTVYLKPIGMATQQNSLGIPDFLEAMFRIGCRNVVFDLGQCTGMDSTFLGVVADAATALPHTPGKTVLVLNACERSVGLLRRIGLLPLISLHTGAASPPEAIEFRQIDFVHFPRTETERITRVKDLHKKLAELNEKNRRTFGSFIAMLEEELAQQEKSRAQ